jgi:hypothetical protein
MSGALEMNHTSTHAEPPEEQRFLQDLPFLVNGTLNTEETQWMQAWLAEHPEHEALLIQAHQERMHSQQLVSRVPQHVRVQRLLHELGWTNLPQHADAEDAKGHSALTVSWKRTWMICLFGVALASAYLAGVHSPTSTPPIDGVRGERAPCSGTWTIRIGLKPQAPWSELFTLLHQQDLQIVSGPTHEGEIWVKGSETMSQTLAIGELHKNPLVEQALPGAPTTTDPCRP